ncbi:MAG: hypothetical protein AAGI52_08020 [Bacteroidota bacterium]
MPRLALLLAALLLASGCAPSLAPTYRDYRVPTALVASADETAPETTETLEARLREALADAGWEETEPDAPNVISTLPRRIDTGVFSHVDASLDLAPISGGFVRVYVHAIRRNIFGSRSKQPFLSPGLRQAALADLTEALAARGLTALDAPRERDEDATE